MKNSGISGSLFVKVEMPFNGHNVSSATEQNKLWQCPLVHAMFIRIHQHCISSLLFLLKWQHVVTLIVNALFCMQMPVPPCPILHSPLPSDFQLRSRQR